MDELKQILRTYLHNGNKNRCYYGFGFNRTLQKINLATRK